MDDMLIVAIRAILLEWEGLDAVSQLRSGDEFADAMAALLRTVLEHEDKARLE